MDYTRVHAHTHTHTTFSLSYSFYIFPPVPYPLLESFWHRINRHAAFLHLFISSLQFLLLSKVQLSRNPFSVANVASVGLCLVPWDSILYTGVRMIPFLPMLFGFWWSYIMIKLLHTESILNRNTLFNTLNFHHCCATVVLPPDCGVSWEFHWLPIPSTCE